MTGLRYTLVADGSSDRALLGAIDWAVHREGVRIEHRAVADLRLLPRPPRDLADRIAAALELYPCDLLFVHRDAERGSHDDRQAEIRGALARHPGLAAVPVIPVRMTEAWLLHDEQAIRKAADNPHGRVSLDLPPPGRVEALPDPKQVLFDALLRASELRGRRLKKLKARLPRLRARVAEAIEDYTPLVGVAAFDRFLAAVGAAVGPWRA